MAWNTSQLLTMVHLNKKHRSWILRTTALNQPWFDGMFYLFMNGWKSFLQSRQPNNRCFCFQGQLEKDHVPLKLSASGCVQNVLSWGVNSKFAAWKRKPVMNIDESWEFRATVYSMFKSMFFFLFHHPNYRGQHWTVLLWRWAQGEWCPALKGLIRRSQCNPDPLKVSRPLNNWRYHR